MNISFFYFLDVFDVWDKLVRVFFLLKQSVNLLLIGQSCLASEVDDLYHYDAQVIPGVNPTKLYILVNG